MNTATAESIENIENIDFEPPAPWLTPARRKALIVAVFVAVVAAWQLVVSALGVSHLIFPGPVGVARSIYEVFQSGEVWPHLWVTLYEILAGFALGAFAGFLLGALIGQSALLELVLYPYVVAFQTVPKVAVAPLFVLWFGFDTTSKVVITATIVFFPVLANTIVGLRSAPRDQIDLMRAFTASPWHVFRMVRLPHALPYVFAGLDIGIVLAVIGAIVGEFVGAQAGLGYLILQRNFSMDAAGMFAILIVLSAIGIVLHGLVKAIARRVVFWAEAFTDLSRGT
ncbi:ABC transporter permease [Variovorax sp. 770b2]|uniref:ABC transporter permease n=1 Tax=Variovorax sp. 770b2 TaxID=1566271 RepID=UPI0008F3CD36|nr:ABC transporter permease [Variovorax sp. 770b2]SFP52943.1 NitT/TauT family transport system permease protein [Variovorax sp. 770b2]